MYRITEHTQGDRKWWQISFRFLYFFWINIYNHSTGNSRRFTTLESAEYAKDVYEKENLPITKQTINEKRN